MTLPHLNTLEKLRGTNSGDQVRFILDGLSSVRFGRKKLPKVRSYEINFSRCLAVSRLEIS